MMQHLEELSCRLVELVGDDDVTVLLLPADTGSVLAPLS